MLTIQLQRQGVSRSFRTWFMPCPHGESWHVALSQWQSSDNYVFDISYPNCRECHGTNSGQTACSTYSRWNGTRFYRPDTTSLVTLSLDEAKERAAKAIARLTGQDVRFSRDVEAYCYANESTLRIWPYIGSDIYVTCATYEPATDTIRHEPTNYCLVAWRDGQPIFDVDAATLPYRELCQKAHDEYIKDHNQRQGERDAKGWLAWLLGEYIKDLPGERPVRLRSVIRCEKNRVPLEPEAVS